MAVLELYNDLREETLLLDWPVYVVRQWKPAAVRGESGSETLEIEIHGIDHSAVYAHASTLEVWLNDAAEATDDGRVSPLWIRHTPTGRAQRQARVRGGSLDTADYVGYTSHGCMLDALLVITREQARGTEGTLPLTNVHGTDVQTGLTVDNAAEAALNNWVGIVGDDVEGDLPAPFRLVFQNTYNNDRRLAQIYYGLRHISTGPTHGAFLQDASSAVEGLDMYTDADANLDTVLRGAGAVVAQWQFASAATRTWEGTWFAFVVGEFDADTEYWLETSLIETELTETKALTPPVSAVAADHIIPLGTIELPPWPKVAPPALPYLFDLVLKSDDNTAETTLDYVLFIPTDLGIRKIAYRAYNAVYQQYTVDDGINDEVAAHYTARAGSIVLGTGQRPKLVPGRDQRLYFVQIGDQGDVLKSRTMSVRVEYAARFALL
ncbi:MAG: hypothetical protein M0R37_10655 [Bacteroidales bacterium]|jgi:hypothetical protein|nr:hypothetical protein [Bacteroidales bacterium]